MPRVIIGILALAILATMAISGTQAALEAAGEDTTIANETWTPDPGNITQLDDSNQQGAYYDENVTVYDENGNLTSAGSDYEWFAGNGTVKALQGGALDGDATATITYNYQQTTREQRQFAALLGELPRMMGLALPIGALLFLFMLLRGGL